MGFKINTFVVMFYIIAGQHSFSFQKQESSRLPHDANCTTIEQTITKNRTPECYCDSKCPIYGDCCKNSPFKVNISLPQPKCSGFANGAYYVKRDCSSRVNKRKCLAFANYSMLTKRLMSVVPVTSLRTGISYGNQFCARCNNVSDFQYWNVSVSCTGNISEMLTVVNNSQKSFFSNRKDLRNKLRFNNVTKTWKMLLANRTENCTLQPALPDSLRPAVRPCVLDVIAKCSTFWGTDEFQSLCSAYQSVVEVSGKLFRNKVCAMCSIDASSMGNASATASVADAPTMNKNSTTKVQLQSFSDYLYHILLRRTTPVESTLSVITSSNSSVRPMVTPSMIKSSQTAATSHRMTPTSVNTEAIVTSSHSTPSVTTTANRLVSTSSTMPLSTHNATRYTYLLLRVHDNCSDMLNHVNATKIRVQTVHYVTMSRTYIRDLVGIKGNHLQVCSVSNATCNSIVDGAQHIPQIVPFAFNIILCLASVFLLLSIRQLLDKNSSTSCSWQFCITMMMYSGAMLLSNVAWFFQNIFDETVNQLFSPFDHIIAYFGFCTSLACVTSLTYHVSCISWKMFFCLSSVVNDRQSKNMYVCTILNWLLPILVTMLKNSLNFTPLKVKSRDFHFLAFLVFPLTVLTSVNAAFYTHLAFIAGAERVVVDKLAKLGINFWFYSTLVGVTHLMWLVALLFYYFSNFLLIVAFYILNLIACLLVYCMACERTKIFALKSVQFLGDPSSSIIINENK